jgi:asparagine synthase (glutamine-hydrolysing)
MCGISGVVGISGRKEREGLVTRMSTRLSHRGPDGSGLWSDSERHLTLGHRRLAVIDISPSASQPMSCLDGACALVFNGEIYNFRELRQRLEKEGCSFKSDSDTEVLLWACTSWGVETAARRANGMFAFAFWDSRDSSVWLCRDRFGEKPLYWFLEKSRLAFASEVQALTELPFVNREIDRDSLATYAKFNCCSDAKSIYVGVNKLAQGTIARFTLDLNSEPRHEATINYYNPSQEALSAYRTPFRGSFVDAVDELDRVLTESVRLRMISDVPLGAFLSGGIDSSLIVGLMNKLSRSRVKTFTIGFERPDMNEAPYAKGIAQYFDTDHTEVILREEDVTSLVPHMATVYSEPFADSSQLPTFLVSQLARQHVSVALSGDGGDELFGGYNRYHRAKSITRAFFHLHPALRTLMFGALTKVPPNAWDQVALTSQRVIRRRIGAGSLGDRLHKLCQVGKVADRSLVYDRLLTTWDAPVVLGASRPEPVILDSLKELNETEQMMLDDTCRYLPFDILTKVDRAAMSVSLETRIPMLDPNLFHLAWQLPFEYKVNSGEGKLVAKSLLGRYLPESHFNRPKMGFGIPLSEWLRGSLRDWAGDLLDIQTLRNQGYFDPVEVHRIWSEHLSGKRNWQYQIWNILMFQAWLEAQNPSSPTSS